VRILVCPPSHGEVSGGAFTKQGGGEPAVSVRGGAPKCRQLFLHVQLSVLFVCAEHVYTREEYGRFQKRCHSFAAETLALTMISSSSITRSFLSCMRIRPAMIVVTTERPEIPNRM
jgi:hypothetical protein